MTLLNPEGFTVPIDAEQAAHQALALLRQEQRQPLTAPEVLIDSAHRPSKAELHDIFVNTTMKIQDDDAHVAYLTDVARRAASEMQASVMNASDRAKH
jgi:hypothetical protein